MTGLLVFDDTLNLAALADVEFTGERMDLFPLIGNWCLLKEVRRFFEGAGVPLVKVIDTARLLEKETEVLAKYLGEWSARLGEEEIEGRTIREWLLSPDGGVSGYWFGAVSERNPLKANLFLRLAQAHALKQQLSTSAYEVCFVALADTDLRKAACRLCVHHNSRVVTLKSRAPRLGPQLRARGWCDKAGFAGQIVLGLATWVRFLYWRFLTGSAVRETSPIESNQKQLLFVTYFPYLDRDAARSGRFRNLYAGPLHDLFHEMGLAVVWLLVFVNIDGRSFREAVALKRRLSIEKECLYFVEEFLSCRSIFRGLGAWIRQAWRGRWLARRMNEELLTEGLSDAACLPILRQLWWRSTAGVDAVKGLLCYEAFKSAFASFPGIRQCLYYCEMQGWETALNAAARGVNPTLKTIGYQHTAISRHFFPYFHAYSDVVKGNGGATTLPIPDVLACNGNVGKNLLTAVGYPHIVMVEAVRQAHLRSLIKAAPSAREKQPTLLVAGSIERHETMAMLSLLAAAFPQSEDVQIWLKGHPSLPMEEVLSTLGIDPAQAGYEIKYGTIGDHLAATWAVLVPASTVAVEALAYGCDVIVPFFSTSLALSPLVGFEHYYHSVYTPEDLQTVFKNIMAGRSKVGTEGKKSFVDDYWCLELPLSRWSALLTETEDGRLQQYPEPVSPVT